MMFLFHSFGDVLGFQRKKWIRNLVEIFPFTDGYVAKFQTLKITPMKNNMSPKKGLFQ